MKTFVSNPKLSDNKFNNGLISVKEGEFYFSFSTEAASDFDLSFLFQEIDNTKSAPSGFTISNTDIGTYKNEYINANYTYLTNVDKNKDINFFEDTIYVSESSPLSLISGVHVYLRSGSPGLSNIKNSADTLFIDGIEYVLPTENQRIYSVTAVAGSNKYKVSRKMDNKTSVFKNISTGDLTYYYNKNNTLDSSKAYDWKLIISQGGKELSIFSKTKNSGTYAKIKTILYNHTIENCFIKLIVGDDVKLSNCSFRFFKANVS